MSFTKLKQCLFIGLIVSLVQASAIASESNSPVGKWMTVDDETGVEKSIVEISQQDGVISGKVVKIFNENDPNPICIKCKGEKANKPITGMEILWGVKQKGDYWSGGKILDPAKGKTYKVKLELEEKGKVLKVRGYIGTPALGRTQKWHRVDLVNGVSGYLKGLKGELLK